MHPELIDIERSLWIDDAAIYERTLLENAVLVFAETGPISRQTAIEAIREASASGPRWAEVHFDDVVQRIFAPDTAMLFYRARARRASGPEVMALCSSLYVRQTGGWKLAFHQQSALPAPPRPRS